MTPRKRLFVIAMTGLAVGAGSYLTLLVQYVGAGEGGVMFPEQGFFDFAMNSVEPVMFGRFLLVTWVLGVLVGFGALFRSFRLPFDP
jgi:hypothetical protein